MNDDKNTWRQYRSPARRRIRELAERICELERQCAKDPLTGLLKSGCFEQQVLERVKKISRGERADDAYRFIESVAIIFIDLDHFKQANDVLGHDAGDRILQILSDIIRDVDLVVRRSEGGDEFLMALFGMNKEEASNRLVGMRKQFEIASKTAFPGLESPASFSFGIEVLSLADMSVASLKMAKREAEGEMYKHKRERAME